MPRLAALHPTAARVTSLALLGALLAPLPARALGTLAELSVVDRSTGQTLPLYTHAGRTYVAGQPGHRYALTVRNRRGERLLAVMSVDGLNVLDGQPAAWGQTGYVFGPWQRYAVSGWRKSDAEVAAFEFTALPDSYAARTGRPANVGVIGVALFRERPAAPVAVAPAARLRDEALGSDTKRIGAARASDAARSTGAPSAEANSTTPFAAAPMAASPLGTGHGARESAPVTHTDFVRRRAEPDELITLWYDSLPNLVARGVVPADALAQRAEPFPLSPSQPYTPDPPPRAP